jgi:hypothetical protein
VYSVTVGTPHIGPVGSAGRHDPDDRAAPSGDANANSTENRRPIRQVPDSLRNLPTVLRPDTRNTLHFNRITKRRTLPITPHIRFASYSPRSGEQEAVVACVRRVGGASHWVRGRETLCNGTNLHLSLLPAVEALGSVTMPAQPPKLECYLWGLRSRSGGAAEVRPWSVDCAGFRSDISPTY